MKLKPLTLAIALGVIIMVPSILVGNTMSDFPPDPDGGYSPWGDLNDDGSIDIFDIVWLGTRYDTTGTPVNKTALLYDVDATLQGLLSKINSLNGTFNSTILDLEGQIADLTTEIQTLHVQMDLLNASLLPLLPQIDDLNATLNLLNAGVVSLLNRVNRLENLTILHNSTYSTLQDLTTETAGWVDMDNMSVQMTVKENCTMLIMFSTEARNTWWADSSIHIRVLVNGLPAHPSVVYLTPKISMEAALQPHRHATEWVAYSYNFYESPVVAGNYTVKIQWRVSDVGTTGYVRSRTLTAIALPLQ